jgi:parallel beta-helix repeat protein
MFDLKNVHATNNGESGVAIQRPSADVISQYTINNYIDGGDFSNNGVKKVVNGVVVGCEPGPEGDDQRNGITVKGGPYNVITNSTINNNYCDGIHIEQSAFNTAVRGNTVRDNGTATGAGYGISLTADQTGVYNHNTISSNTALGNGSHTVKPGYDLIEHNCERNSTNVWSNNTKYSQFIPPDCSLNMP